MDKETINQVYEMPQEYKKALLGLELLNQKEDVKDIEDMNENHEIYIQVYQQAIDSPAKDRAIAARQRALALA
jgi:hypothetical protein